MSEDTDLPLEAVQTLLNGFIHSLKNPIQTIALHADILQDPKIREMLCTGGPSLPEIEEVCGAIIDEAKKAGRILDRFANTIGRIPTRFVAIDLNQLIVETLQPFLASSIADIEMRLEPSLPKIRGDWSLIALLLENLVRNAVEALPPQNGRIVVTSYSTKDGATLIIEDNGSGITAENIERIFDWNFTTKQRSMGIGLYLVKRCINIHRGTIACRSSDGATVFEVTLPRAEAQQ